MLIQHLIGTAVGLGVPEVQTIKRECSQFLIETAGSPLLKSLPSNYPNFHKVKVRLQRRRDVITDVFERAFGHDFANLRQRAIFAYPNSPSDIEGCEQYYIFPINGYKFLYSREVSNSGAEYRHVVETLCQSFSNTDQASDVIVDLLKCNYAATSLQEAIEAKAEVILYGIPYYYAVKVSACKDYAQLLSIANL